MILLVAGDNVSTDDIMPAGRRVMPYWSSVYASAPFTFEAIDADYVRRAEATREHGGHAIVAGHNYGQGFSRENAALVPRYLGLQVVLAKSFARIHWQNLICFGALPLSFIEEADAARLEQGDAWPFATCTPNWLQGRSSSPRSSARGISPFVTT
ncbi:hypothetical protein [Billgrantia endophytica]|uniref:hypothetical protein n=1 Tax=Billgrantia endophytica TaxID=2033802 RepID=UPI001F0C8117|nr:hypothetical protein [Halomonas endophytica]